MIIDVWHILLIAMAMTLVSFIYYNLRSTPQNKPEDNLETIVEESGEDEQSELQEENMFGVSLEPLKNIKMEEDAPAIKFEMFRGIFEIAHMVALKETMDRRNDLLA